MRHGVLRFFVVVRLQERHTGICFAKALRLGEAVGCVNHAFGGGCGFRQAAGCFKKLRVTVS